MITTTPTDRARHTVIASPPERFDVVVIGGGQAGLATGYELAQRGIRFVILDAHERVGEAWRRRWDSLHLFTPARFNSLPGMPFPGPPLSYPTKDQVADYIESYAETMQLPVRTGIEVRDVSRSADGGWTVQTSKSTLKADAVVIATGGYQTPRIPEWATALDTDIVQLHSVDYRNPSQLQPGGVLVVGASHSGAEIAFETAKSHPTVLAGRDTGQLPFRTGGRFDRLITRMFWFAVNHVLTLNTPIGRKAQTHVRAHGFPLQSPSRRDLAEAGVERITERATGARDGKPVLDDGQMLDVRNVIWCTGFHGDYSWIEGMTYGADGYPEQERGMVATAPGLCFVGLKFQQAGASSLVGGVGRDAAYVANRIAATVKQVR